MSIGTDRVRVGFNPDGIAEVTTLKQKTADLIDLCESLKDPQAPEKNRHLALAMTAYEEACLWAVKAVTA